MTFFFYMNLYLIDLGYLRLNGQLFILELAD